MENHLKRVLKLVRKTGDTMIVVEKDTDESFVVMDLDRYESLIDSSKFPSGNVVFEENKAEASPLKNVAIWDVMQDSGTEGETWNLDQLSDEELLHLERQYEEFAKRNVQEAVKETVKQQQKAVKDTNENIELTEETDEVDDNEYGEEQFYLEPIE